MTEQRTDAQLVAGYVAGDRQALAAIYDRHAGALYDTAAAMLSDRDEAADAMQDVFVVAAEQLGRLRDPDRLRAWLFAVLRNEVYRRSKRRSRQRPTDKIGRFEVAADGTHDRAGDQVEMAQLAGAIRAASRGLDHRDQLALELSVRHGLSGTDLADALGLSVAQAAVVIHRMRERLQRSLSAFAVASGGRRDCPDLAQLLGSWDGAFDVLIRKRVARHIENCTTCAETSRRLAVLPMYSLAPAILLPVALRDRVLRAAFNAGAGAPGRHGRTGQTGRPAVAVVRGEAGGERAGAGAWRDDGFPGTPAERRAAGGWLPRVAAVVALVVGAAIVGSWFGGDEPVAGPLAGTASAVGGGAPLDTATPTVAAPEASPATAGPGSIVDAPTVPSPAGVEPTGDPSDSVVAPAPVSGPLVVAPPPGPTEPPSANPPSNPPANPPPVRPTNPSTSRPRPVTTTTGPRPVTTTSPRLVAAVTTTTRPRPVTTTTISRRLVAPSTTVPADVTPPVVDIVTAPGALRCPWSINPLFTAVVTDRSAIRAVTLQLVRSGAAPVVSAMTVRSGRWSARPTVPAINAVWRYVVRATDAAGNVGGASGTLVVSGCAR